MSSALCGGKGAYFFVLPLHLFILLSFVCLCSLYFLFLYSFVIRRTKGPKVSVTAGTVGCEGKVGLFRPVLGQFSTFLGLVWGIYLAVPTRRFSFLLWVGRWFLGCLVLFVEARGHQ